MNKLTITCALAVSLAGCASTSGVLPIGGGNYQITTESEFSAAKMHQNAITEANAYCASLNLDLEVIDTASGDAGIGWFTRKKGFAIQFRCIEGYSR